MENNFEVWWRRHTKVTPSVKYTRHTKDCVCHSTKHTELQKWIYSILLSSYTSFCIVIATHLGHSNIPVLGSKGVMEMIYEICHESFIQKALTGYLCCTCGIFKAPHLNEEKVIWLRKLRFLY